MSAEVRKSERRNKPITLGMKRKMFSYGWSLALPLGCTAAPLLLALPFARFRTADIVGGVVGVMRTWSRCVRNITPKVSGATDVPRCLYELCGKLVYALCRFRRLVGREFRLV
jgi:hypothetical protein